MDPIEAEILVPPGVDMVDPAELSRDQDELAQALRIAAATPAADVMGRAVLVLGDLDIVALTFAERRERVARALQQYGDERAKAAIEGAAQVIEQLHTHFAGLAYANAIRALVANPGSEK